MAARVDERSVPRSLVVVVVVEATEDEHQSHGVAGFELQRRLQRQDQLVGGGAVGVDAALLDAVDVDGDAGVRRRVLDADEREEVAAALGRREDAAGQVDRAAQVQPLDLERDGCAVQPVVLVPLHVESDRVGASGVFSSRTASYINTGMNMYM